jgi:hypothetical protein
MACCLIVSKKSCFQGRMSVHKCRERERARAAQSNDNRARAWAKREGALQSRPFTRFTIVVEERKSARPPSRQHFCGWRHVCVSGRRHLSERSAGQRIYHSRAACLNNQKYATRDLTLGSAQTLLMPRASRDAPCVILKHSHTQPVDIEVNILIVNSEPEFLRGIFHLYSKFTQYIVTKATGL